MLGLYVNCMYTLIHLQIKIIILKLFLSCLSPRSILVVSVGYRIIFNDSIVNNCIMHYFETPFHKDAVFSVCVSLCQPLIILIYDVWFDIRLTYNEKSLPQKGQIRYAHWHIITMYYNINTKN